MSADEYTGRERRRKPPATRRFVVIAAGLLTLYVSGILAFATSRTSDGDLRNAIRSTTLNSCIEGNKLRAEVGRPPQDCNARLEKLPR